MNIFDDHKKLYTVAGLFFLSLTFLTAILPALQNQKNNAPLPGSMALSETEMAGKKIYISEGCVGCHSQQVRNVDMDKVFGKRPGMAADYARIHRTSLWVNTATLMGTGRTGPDLTDIGNRQPSVEWNLIHLYNPRILVPESIMPSYAWLFEAKEKPTASDVIVSVPPSFAEGKKGKIIAKKEALQLVAYLQSLKQVALPESIQPMQFLYKMETKNTGANGNALDTAGTELDGKQLYITHCQACHQENGEGLPGAFPPLKGSKIVSGDNLELYVDIIMNGYDARQDFGIMAGVGTVMNFTEHEVAALINYERTNWGNEGKKVSPEEIKKIMDFVKVKASAQ